MGCYMSCCARFSRIKLQLFQINAKEILNIDSRKPGTSVFDELGKCAETMKKLLEYPVLKIYNNGSKKYTVGFVNVSNSNRDYIYDNVNTMKDVVNIQFKPGDLIKDLVIQVDADVLRAYANLDTRYYKLRVIETKEYLKM